MTTLTPLQPTSLISHLHWRYATKVFDTARTIPAETWKVLEETLVLTPSSYGLQPWKFIVITDKALLKKLLAHSWGQKQVVDCSHYVIFATRTQITEEDFDRHLIRTSQVRGMPIESLKGFREKIVADLIHGERSKVAAEWAARQAYIALGNFMTAAALLQIDTCPMEGFVREEYDQVLGLPARGLTATVCCAAGYRSASDKYASVPKVRFPEAELIEHI